MNPSGEDRGRLGGRQQELVEKIRSAFADVAYPGDDRLVDMVPGGFNHEQKDLLHTYRGKHWRDLTVRDMPSCPSPCFFTPVGYHFFLPAYLIASIQEYKDADVMPEDTIWRLDPWFQEESGRTEKFKSTIALFSSAQRNTIRSFLEFMRDEHGADFAYSDIDLDRLIAFYT